MSAMTEEWLDAYRLGLGTAIVAIDAVREKVTRLGVEWVAREAVEEILAQTASGLRVASARAS